MIKWLVWTDDYNGWSNNCIDKTQSPYGDNDSQATEQIIMPFTRTIWC